MKTEQPLWGRGQMVSPQHFQQQAAYAAWSAECIARLGLTHPWGVIDATFEPDALKLGRLQARHLHIRFPDGTLIDTDNADDLPEEQLRQLADLPENQPWPDAQQSQTEQHLQQLIARYALMKQKTAE